MSFFLLDECVAKCCLRGGADYTAMRTVSVPSLGSAAEDARIYEHVRAVQECVLVTLNAVDFARLAIRNGWINVIVLPSVPPRRQRSYLRSVAPLAEQVFKQGALHFVEVGAGGEAIAYNPKRGIVWKARGSVAYDFGSADRP